MEKARCNTELYSNLRVPLNNVKPSNFWGSHHYGQLLFFLEATENKSWLHFLHTGTKQAEQPLDWAATLALRSLLAYLRAPVHCMKILLIPVLLNGLRILFRTMAILVSFNWFCHAVLNGMRVLFRTMQVLVDYESDDTWNTMFHVSSLPFYVL